MLYIHLHSAKHRMRYDPEKIVTHGCKSHVLARSLFTYKKCTYVPFHNKKSLKLKSTNLKKTKN